jgi:hypothetical protein
MDDPASRWPVPPCPGISGIMEKFCFRSVEFVSPSLLTTDFLQRARISTFCSAQNVSPIANLRTGCSLLHLKR